ncbi:uncharacterized protein (TIGR02271 family) [Pontibacter aydingkolensis]|uniref:YsnF/AvaK domain-containing protein n=1 Tax=Pontibacter aydingkolensis TaxID=1911536 RepID=A0ABS7CXX4_9BACT|nr:YsnF/AvaK domain-containing protein [Pontibacter aydingkolensis]MBW7468630.1 YsnF/AvaK domain-containing protein [Pontibacter aydingkolensis]
MKININKNKVQQSEFEKKLQQSKIEDHDPAQEDEVVPVIEEQVDFDLQTVEKGKVRVSKLVHEEDVIVDVPFAYEDIDVQRVAKNLSIDSPPEVRYDGDTMIIPVIKEEVVIQKRLVLVEELHITKRRVEEHHPQQVTLRKEEVKVDRQENNTTIQ